MAQAKRLQDEFGGRWDGARLEIHGLIERDERRLKIELLYVSRRDTWSVSIFDEGRCVGSAAAPDAVEAVRAALEQV